jgi:hypothetical protein
MAKSTLGGRPSPDPNPSDKESGHAVTVGEFDIEIGSKLTIRRPIGVNLRPTPTPGKPDDFRDVLKVLANNREYRNAATEDPSMIIQDFDLSVRELQALRGVALLSGADLRAVDKLVGAEIITHPGGLVSDVDVDVSCCSCCCCCCGETSVAVS